MERPIDLGIGVYILQFTLPHRERLTGSGPGPTQMRFQFTLPRRERPYKVPNIWLIINFNSRSRIGSVDIHDTFHVQV